MYALLGQGLDVDIACSPDADALKLQRQGYTVRTVPIDRRIDPRLNLRTIYQLQQVMLQQQYDLVHVHTPIAAVLGRVAAKLAGVPRIVYTAHGFPFHDQSSPRQYWLYSQVERVCAQFTDLILSQNHEDIEMADRLGLCSSQRIQYLGNGVDIERFSRDRLHLAKQQQLRQSLGIPDAATCLVGTVCRLTRKKGCGDLVAATAQLLPQFPGLHVVIIGGELQSDPECFRAELEAQVRSLGLASRVTLTGDRADIPELLGLLDIFALPTFTHEGLPRSILEAMAMELPVVATDIRGCREAVVHQQTGLIVPPRDHEQLAQALSTLAAESGVRQGYGQRVANA